MPEGDAWDWPLLYYTGTVLLNMSTNVFWRTAPRKLHVLAKVHVDVNAGDKKKDKISKTGYIDQVL